MSLSKLFGPPAITVLVLCLVLCLSGTPTWAQTADAVSVTTAGKSISELLPDLLGGLRAAAPPVTASRDSLSQVAGERSDIYKEYRVLSAGSRLYGQYRVSVFKTEDQSGAFGLYDFNSNHPVKKDAPAEVGFGNGWSANGFFFWQGPYFVNVSGVLGRLANGQVSGAKNLAAAISRVIGTGDPRTTPFLLENLPLENGAAPAVRYALGPKSLDSYVQRGSDVFSFNGDAEAAVVQYPQPGSTVDSAFQLVMVEYNTPQFAIDELEKARDAVAVLTPDEQSKTIVKRIGNYIVEANGVTDRTAAERVMNSITYPYTVKMLRNPRSRDPDPRFGQKTAQVLLSSIGIIVLMVGAALAVGIAFGSVVFFRRRRQLRDIFSDAGGMLRLDIEPLGTGSDQTLITGASHALKGAGEP
ncbi:MAG TPA: DUF6599 family protein [Blastocatellia bacterium]|nr:DUF6599 family protein [Blastocatellia bacterium]